MKSQRNSNIPPEGRSGAAESRRVSQSGGNALRVGLDARYLSSPGAAGIASYVLGLASGLSALEDGNEEYLFLVERGDVEWLGPHLTGPCRLLVSREPYRGPPRTAWRWIKGKAPALGRIRSKLVRPPTALEAAVSRSDGTIEAAAIDVMHFTWQNAFLTNVPSIYQPHDLQHVHLPGNFTPDEYRRRELAYRTHCDQASLVVVMTSWGKRDLIRQYGIPPEKVAVINHAADWGSVLSADPSPTAADLAVTRRKLGLPETFLLYPAQTWPHKNHEGLLEALALARERHGVSLPLVCTGHRTELWPTLSRRASELGLERMVWFPGLVSTEELRCLYAMARALVFPSKFEGWGMPVSEAFAAGVPVTCSTATVLPSIAGDAALLFEPDDTQEIAECVFRLWTEPDLRRSLVERGRLRATHFTADHAVRLFRAHYRRIGGGPMSDQDRDLLAAAPAA